MCIRDRYNGEKLTFAEAGAKRVASLDQNDPGSESTADRLAAEFKVSAPTIKRDGQYAAAVDKLATVGIEPQSVIAHVAKKAVGEIPSNSGELEPHRYCAQIPRMVDGEMCIRDSPCGARRKGRRSCGFTLGAAGGAFRCAPFNLSPHRRRLVGGCPPPLDECLDL